MDGLRQIKHIGTMFKPEMIIAIKGLRKTQTRRLLSAQPPQGWDIMSAPAKILGKITEPGNPKRGRMGVFIERDLMTDLIPLRYGWVDDYLYVKETWRINGNQSDYDLAYTMKESEKVFYRADESWNDGAGWRSAMLMPRWARRFDLRIVGKRVERVQNITPHDARAEGFDSIEDFAAMWNEMYHRPKPVKYNGEIDHYVSYPFAGPRRSTRSHDGLMHLTYGNPLVEVTEFELLDTPLTAWQLHEMGIDL